MKKGTLGIIGAGDLGQHMAHYAKVINQFDKIVFFDDVQKTGSSTPLGIIAGNTAQIELLIKAQKIQYLLIGIGYKHMDIRASFFKKFSALIPFPNLIHPSVYLDVSTQIGAGNIILPGCIIDKGCIIGDNNFFNPGCVIAHDNIIKDHSFFGPAIKTSGFVTIGSKCFMGTATTTVDNISVCDNVYTGARTLITKNIKIAGTYVGSPAKKIR